MLCPLHEVINEEQYKKLENSRYGKYGQKAYIA